MLKEIFMFIKETCLSAILAARTSLFRRVVVVTHAAIFATLISASTAPAVPTATCWESTMATRTPTWANMLNAIAAEA